MKNYSKEQALRIMVDAAENYDKMLKDKHFLIIYLENTKIKTVQVGFRIGKNIDFSVSLY